MNQESRKAGKQKEIGLGFIAQDVRDRQRFIVRGEVAKLKSRPSCRSSRFQITATNREMNILQGVDRL